MSDFAFKKLPAELCLGQVSNNTTDEAVREALRQSFVNLDREYFNYIGEKLALRMAKRLENGSDPHLVQLDMETLVGASATVSILLDNSKLFVANAGDVRAVICSLKPDGDVKALPLSIDHLVSNEDEILRLTQLGLKVEDVMKITERTRCLGYHQVKGGYKEVDFLKEAQDEPVLVCPELHGPFVVKPEHLFMIIFTRPLAQCIEQISASLDGDINTELCRITHEQFAENTTVSGVAQSVVDKVVRMHRDHFETEVDNERSWRREDLTLLVRNFNAKLANSSKRGRTTSVNLNNLDAPTTVTPQQQTQDLASQQKQPAQQPVLVDATRSSTTTESSADTFTKQTDRELSVDENGRIKPYVDFSYFHKEWQKYCDSMKPNGTQ